MTTRAALIAEQLRAALEALDDLDSAEQEQLISAIVRHLQARRPECVASLAAQWEPTEQERDPRL